MIIKDKTKLEQKCSPVSVKEGEEIGARKHFAQKINDLGWWYQNYCFQCTAHTFCWTLA